MTTASNRRPASGQEPFSMSASMVSVLPASRSRAAPSRSTAVTGWPRSSNQRTWRPLPQARSSTVPPAGTRGVKRTIQGEGASVPCMGSTGADIFFQGLERHGVDDRWREQLDEAADLALRGHDHLALPALHAVDDQPGALVDRHHAVFLQAAGAGGSALRVEAAVAELRVDGTGIRDGH